MKSFIAILALSICTPWLFAADLSGTWLHSAKQADGHTSQMVLALQQSGNTLTGKIEHPWGALIIKQGNVDGDHFSVSATTNEGRSYVCEGTLEGDKLRFTVHDGDAKPYEVVAARAKSDPFQSGALTTRSCARWPTPWCPAVCATRAMSTSTSTTPGKATATPTV